jgi:hypothetical protein
MECLLYGPPVICEKGRTLGKTYGIKVGYYSKHLGKDIGNNRK